MTKYERQQEILEFANAFDINKGNFEERIKNANAFDIFIASSLIIRLRQGKITKIEINIARFLINIFHKRSKKND